MADHHDEFRQTVLRSVKINLTHTLDFNPDTEILDRQIASMTSGQFVYWKSSQRDYVMYSLIVTMVFTVIFVVIILVIFFRNLRLLKRYSQQNDDLIEAEITLEQGITVLQYNFEELFVKSSRALEVNSYLMEVTQCRSLKI